MAIAFGLFGLMVGSFLNVLILRWGERSLSGRSACMACGKQLRWYDLMPILSWVFLRGRCRMCGSRISIQYPLVEAATGALFASVALVPLPLGFLYQLAFCAIMALLVAIFVYDLYYAIIPDAWVWTFNALALLLVFVSPLQATHSIDSGQASFWLPALLAGPLAALPLFVIWASSALRGLPFGAWMGFGDIKLALGIGWLLGPALGLFSILLAFVIGAVISVPLVLFSSDRWRRFVEEFTPTAVSRRLAWQFTMKSEIPFGPFLILSCITIWFLSMYNLDPLRIFGLSL
ncbi:hypothetical protein A2763_03670 [Candidatus Kaiserbacteria bacterium RIFCSPHIGHO2_01_FULL_54_36]|uniref:Peptidase A24A N-terminal domain-containing protein n=1 Tax=Candidatus Kaiserbacteria bacterium RIFCSPHIGHO2_01_FULL_54_36 TaxID=1798482 RepID=A0A1F6CNK8_9BACT|nr:MAG: hypothetical protein A2763_03670 [Candidatus Kaiserbacteria bacterium RIFCSPHIGHO2_01_FULL_54_36]OGG75962.1 MAG: hypothetical protein A3A41_01765 [Candidatus Kaiserbacteria bacterium RIFCSPLOWO2_01_FULL_54_22]